MGLVLPAKSLFISFAAASVAAAQSQPAAAQRIAAHVRPNDLKADVSFLASDALQGRATPSPGLDIAAEYIAAQFRRAGLEPVGDDGYFQNANYQSVKPNMEGLTFTLGAATAAGRDGGHSRGRSRGPQGRRGVQGDAERHGGAGLSHRGAGARQGAAGGSARRRCRRPGHGGVSGAAAHRGAGWKTGTRDGGDGARRRIPGQSERPRADARRYPARAQGADPERVGQGDLRRRRRGEDRTHGSRGIGARGRSRGAGREVAQRGGHFAWHRPAVEGHVPHRHRTLRSSRACAPTCLATTFTTAPTTMPAAPRA